MTPLSAEQQRRVAATVAVRDTDHIPKVEGAGDVVDRGGGRVQVMHNGVLIEEGCYHGAMMTAIIRELRGHHEPQEEAAFHEVIDRLRAVGGDRPTMIELGSYWAYYSMWFNRALTGARNIMVEPDLVNLDVGRRNFALNGMDGTFVHGAAGFDHDGTARIPWESDGRVHAVPTVTLEGLMLDHGLATVDVLLCDTQGAEAAVLASAAELIAARRIRFLVVSTHHHVISGDALTHQRCLDVVRRSGALVIAEHSVSESCSGDGLIVASTDPSDAGVVVTLTHTRAKDSLFGELEYDLARALRLQTLRRRVTRPFANGLARLRTL